MALILGLESSCDDSAAALVDQRPADPRPGGRRPERGAPPFGGVVPEIAARAHVEILPGLIRQVLAEADVAHRRGRRHRRDRRPRADRRGDGRPARRQGAGACDRQAADRGQPSRRPCAVAAAGRSRPRLSLSAAARLGRPLPVARSARGRRLSPAGDDHRRCRRRGVRQGREAARPALSRRPGDRGAGARRRSASGAACRARCSAAASRISPSPASRARSSAPSPAGAHQPADIAASFQQAVVDCLVDRTALALAALSDAPTLVVAGGVAANRSDARRPWPSWPRPTAAPSACRRAGCAPTMRR